MKVRTRTRSFLWFTDPWEWMYHPLDTTMRLAQESSLLGHGNYWASVKTLRLENGKILADVHPLELAPDDPDARGGPMKRGKSTPLTPAAFDCIQWRMDPPVDHTYYHPLQILLLGIQGSRRKPEIVNPPEALCFANEKMEPALLGDFMPASVVSSQWQPLSEFGLKEGRTVLKPLDWCQSKGIELLDWRTAEMQAASKALLEKSTDQFKRPVLLQRYLPGIQQGERRLWFADGKPIAHMLKFPVQGDFRVNTDRGSRMELAPLTKKEQRVIPAIARRLRARKIRLAAVDLIEAKVSDYNFTSPGLIPQMENLTGENLARKIMKALSKAT
ncbi:MAG: hypothetical protein A2X94_12840 [Bdellovibrionales bacterium GWB1_55_8]|nr:MAG: hypothetical protein A2X94_12840 [Bdellovibrionales bacterium GWB1_55_8]